MKGGTVIYPDSKAQECSQNQHTDFIEMLLGPGGFWWGSTLGADRGKLGESLAVT